MDNNSSRLDQPRDIDFTKTGVTKEDAPERKEEIKVKKLYEYSVYDTLINTKDAYYSFFDDITKDGIDYPKFTIFTKNNRLFYLGLGLLIMALIFMIINSLVFTKSDSTPKFIVKIDRN